MSQYPHILQPFKLKKKILKSRIMSNDIQPFLIQGPEPFPTENVIQYYAGIAANGAAIVTVRCGGLRDRTPRMKREYLPARGHSDYDIYDEAVRNYYSQLADAIHFHGSLASISLELAVPMELLIGEVTPKVLEQLGENANTLKGTRVVTREEIKAIIAGVAEQALLYKQAGYDCCELHFSYRAFIMAAAMSPIINTRTDEYGGSFENRYRMALEMLQEIRKACGPDFIVIVHISGEEPEEQGYKLQDVMRFADMADGLIDILEIRAGDNISAHPSGFNSTKEHPPTLEMAAAVKAHNVNMLVAACGGFQDPEIIEQVLREGKVDLVAMARTYFSNWDNYYQCLLDGRGEDVIPCIRCLKCTGDSIPNTKLNLCSVNPKMGIPVSRRAAMIRPSDREKRVAVIGGGPAGMYAALTLRDRGHQVTLYEKSDSLGGQLRHADHVDFKWPVRDFKNYLIAQVQKRGIEIRFNTEATPELIRSGMYDAVIAALGAKPHVLSIPGADGDDIWAPIDVFGRSEKLGHHVVIVGGGETGTETGLYLARSGHEVTVISRQDCLAKESLAFYHYGETVKKFCRDTEHFQALTNAKTTEVSGNSVTYIAADGEKHVISCDSVVVSGGTDALSEEALAFYGQAPQFFVIGDAQSPGSILTSTRTAYAAACHI